ncbi:MAG: adenylate/guanylate cyclase domain-containing protein [Bradyrhizobium sp.]
MPGINERLLDERLAQLETSRGSSPRVLSKLESHMRTASDAALFRINALGFAHAFHDPVAVRAALDMRSEIATFNSGRPGRELILKIGVHRGSVIAVTLNERLDYFGQAVNIAARVQNLADTDEIYVSGDVYDAPGVAEILAPFGSERSIARLKGVHEEMAVYRVAATPIDERSAAHA